MNSVTVPIHTVSVLNRREHWSARARRAKAHRQAASLALRAANVPKVIPEHVLMVRIAPRALDRHDNLAASMKNLVDGVADYFGIRDDDPRIKFDCAQERGQPNEYAVRIEVGA